MTRHDRGSRHSLIFPLQLLSCLLGFGENEPLEVCWITQGWDVKMAEFMQAWSMSVTVMKHT